MAARPTWKGHLKISLVTVPVRVFPATSAEAVVRFNQLHGECQTRLQQKRWCPRCDREIDKTDVVKGYEFERGRYVVLDEDDLAKARPESTRIINLERFADMASIDPIYVDKPYYLAPDGDVAASAFAVIRDALRGKAGIGKLALSGREHAVAIQPRENGLVMFTLRRANEVRRMSAVEELDRVPDEPSSAEVALARQVIGNFEGPIEFGEFEDQYQAQLRSVIDAKIAGEEIVVQEEESPAKVVDLMAALRKSLDSVSAAKKKPARATETAARKTAKPRRKRAS